MKVEDQSFKSSPFGLSEYSLLPDIFFNANVRDKVIIRVNILAYSLKEILTKTTIEEDFKTLYDMVAGRYTDAEDLSVMCRALYIKDNRFREFLASKYYYNMNDDPTPIGKVIINTMKNEYCDLANTLIETYKADGHNPFILDKGFLYVAVPDLNFVMNLRLPLICECLSIPKKWNKKVLPGGSDSSLVYCIQGVN